jgi:hypothetical protein
MVTVRISVVNPPALRGLDAVIWFVAVAVEWPECGEDEMGATGGENRNVGSRWADRSPKGPILFTGVSDVHFSEPDRSPPMKKLALKGTNSGASRAHLRLGIETCSRKQGPAD